MRTLIIILLLAGSVIADEIIGYNGEVEDEFEVGTLCHANTQDSYTAVTGDTVDQFHALLNVEAATSVYMAVYTITGGDPVTQVATETELTHQGSNLWESATGLDIELSNGTEYVVAITIAGEGISVMFTEGNDPAKCEEICSNDLPATWVESPTCEGVFRLKIWATVTQPSEDNYRRRRILQMGN